MILPDPKVLQAAWLELQDIHKEYLAVHGVKLPKADHYADSTKSLQLAVLHHCKDREVHKDEISAIAQRDRPSSGADQQVRHLKRDGWSIGDKPGIHKLNPYEPSSELKISLAREQKRLGARDFDEIKQSFGERCATCGAREGRPDPRYGGANVALQKGHQDPTKPESKNNIIPQCQFCNRAYRNDYEFDDKGRVKAVASIRPVRKAQKRVQLEVLDWLQKKFRS